MTAFGMFLEILAPLILVLIFYLLDSRTSFGKMKIKHRQIIAGAVFGALACAATQFGIYYDGYVMNVRSAAPLTAGLIFGGPAGLISGFIGAVYRYVSVMWGVPAYTQVACTVATLLAGIIGTLCRSFMFDNKRTSWFYGIFIAIATEVFHMLLVFLTHMDDIQTAFEAVETIAVFMISANAFAVMLPLAFTDYLSSKRKKTVTYIKPITQTFSVFLFICIFMSFFISTEFAYYVQKNVTDMEVDNLISMNIKDVLSDIGSISGEGAYDDVLKNVASNRHIGQSGFMFIVADNGTLLSAPKNSVTTENITQFINAMSQLPDGEILKFKTVEGVTYYYEKERGDGFTVVGCMPESEVNFSRNISVYIEGLMLLFLFFILFVVVFMLIKLSIVRNVHRVNEALGKITEGDLSTVVEVRDNEEFSNLSDDINSTVDRLKGLIADAEKRNDIELAFAKTVQSSVLPSVFPAYPDRAEFDIYAYMDTAKEVGGDFYDFYLLDENRLAFLIADVSGKGIAAAMFMMNAKSVIKSFAETGHTVSEVFSLTNESLCQNNDAELFVTAWMGIIDLLSGNIKFANAGHNPPLVKRKGGSFEFLSSRPSLVLGAMDGIRYRENEINLSAGDELFLYTDGVTEATDINNHLFGNDRLRTLLNSGEFDSAESVCNAVKNGVNQFVGDASQFDDITMLSLKYKPHGEEIMHSLTLSASNENMDTVIDFVDTELIKAKCPAKTVTQINIVIDELFSNIANYAYPDKNGEATVSVGVFNNTVSLKFEDSGVEFNPLKADDPDITKTAEEREIGGLGIFMIKKIMDSVEYEYIDGKNTLTLKKLF